MYFIKKSKTVATYLLKVFILALIYHLAARLGLKMAYVQINTSPVWPPTGIALATLLLFGYNLWPGITLGVLLGSVLTGARFHLALGMSIGNTLEALVAAICLRRYLDFRTDMNRVQDVINLLIVSIFSTIISATIGASTLMLTGIEKWQGFRTIWTTWWIGDLLGALVVAPMLLVWLTPPPFQTKRRIYIESGIFMTLLSLTSWYIFSNQPPEGIFHQALLYVIFPFMIWAALRFGQRGVTTAILLLSGIAIFGTAQGMGPFSLESKNDSLVLLQTFMGVVSLTTLILAAAIIERRKANEALRQRVDDLVTLNDSSRTFLDNFDITSLYHTICNLAVTRLGLDAAWVETTAWERQEMFPVAVYGTSPETIPILKAMWEKDAISQDQDRVRVKTIDDLDPSLINPDINYQVYAAFPLIFSNKLIGELKLLSANKQFFTKERLPLIQSYANLAAVVIQNTWLFGEVQKSNKQLHALSQRLMKAQEEERLHLSRELHDESGQLLAALTVQLGLLERDAGHLKIIDQRINELKLTANKIQDNLHKLAVNLRPASLDHLGLINALQQYVEEFSRQYNIVVEFENIGMRDKRLPIDVETALFRIVQESLTNVVLHAQATRVDVFINIRNSHVIAIIEDNGVGFIPTSPTVESHLGLFGMRERIEMLGGKLTIESSPGRGTTINIEVPSND
ncbi:MAG: MASE1 domain-containing protein [Chloroflexota bacterium]